MINDTYVFQSDDGMLIFGRALAFRCRLSLSYVTGTMNTRDFRKMIKLIIWACADPEVIHDALHLLDLAFTHTIKLSKSAPKNMKYLQEVKSKYELQ